MQVAAALPAGLSTLDERKKIVVELILVRDHHSVGRARIDLQYCILDEL
jgi:hypothetical protein